MFLPGTSTLLLNLMTKILTETSLPFKRMMLKNSPPLNIFGIAPLLKERIPPMNGSVFGAGMCLSPSMLHVRSFMYLVLEEGVLSLVRLPFQPTIWPDIKH
jgi:hypothetical protein